MCYAPHFVLSPVSVCSKGEKGRGAVNEQGEGVKKGGRDKFCESPLMQLQQRCLSPRDAWVFNRLYSRTTSLGYRVPSNQLFILVILNKSDVADKNAAKY
jgi:hypothetical protein